MQLRKPFPQCGVIPGAGNAFDAGAAEGLHQEIADRDQREIPEDFPNGNSGHHHGGHGGERGQELKVEEPFFFEPDPSDGSMSKPPAIER